MHFKFRSVFTVQIPKALQGVCSLVILSAFRAAEPNLSTCGAEHPGTAVTLALGGLAKVFCLDANASQPWYELASCGRNPTNTSVTKSPFSCLLLLGVNLNTKTACRLVWQLTAASGSRRD